MKTPAVTEAVPRQNAVLRASLPFHDSRCFADAEAAGSAGWTPQS